MLLSAVAVGLTLALAAAPAWASGSSAKPVPAKVVPPISVQVEQVATSAEFGSTYGGDVAGQDGVATVYVTNAGMSAMASALSAANIPSSAYKLVSVAHSMADLHQLTMQLAGDQEALSSRGINLVQWGPDASSNTVLAQISGYTSAAARALQAQYGGSSKLTVQPWTGPAHGQLASNRYYDNPPFWSGDRIFPYDVSNKCTAGFGLVGNSSGTHFNTSAGHCGYSGWTSIYTNYSVKYQVGNVSTNYLTNGDQLDVESFPCNCGIYVWYEGPGVGTGQGSTHTIVGWCDCNTGNYVAFDGATTGEAAGAYVDSTNICTSANFFGDGYTRCYMNRAHENATICQGGDSGGPVYQRSSNNTAYATGTIVGSFYSGSTEYCYYARMSRILYQLNVSLLHG